VLGDVRIRVVAHDVNEHPHLVVELSISSRVVASGREGLRGTMHRFFGADAFEDPVRKKQVEA
jgi:hypothetical protein